MRCRMRKPCKLKERCYTSRMIDINEYLAELPGAKTSDKIGKTDINEMI